MKCPHCGSTDMADLVTDKHDPSIMMVCLDCNKIWRKGGRK